MPIGRTDKVDNQLDSSPIRFLQDAVSKVLFAIINHHICAQRFHTRHLFGARRRKDGRALPLGELNGRGTDTTATCMNEHGHACLPDRFPFA